jgi:hypothetical protein
MLCARAIAELNSNMVIRKKRLLLDMVIHHIKERGCGYGRRLCPQPLLPQRHGMIPMRLTQIYLIGGKIALRPYQYQGLAPVI